MRSLGWGLFQYVWYLYKKRKFGHRQIQRDVHVKIQGHDHLPAKRDTSEETNPADTLTSEL